MALAPKSKANSPFRGTIVLIWLMLRKDKFKLPAWIAGLVLFLVYVITAIPAAYGEGEELQNVTQLLADPMGRLLTGPGYGLIGQANLERVVSSGYGLYLMILVALMSIFLIVRHTRVEEQTGRAELVRANVVGQSAQLLAAGCWAIITNFIAVVTIFLTLILLGNFPISGSLLLAVSIGCVGLAFAGVTMITVQLSEYSKVASGIAGGALGAAFVLRAGGDMASPGGSVLSWASPLGWAQQTAPYVLDRWWPLSLLVALTITTILIGYHLSTRRDLGASLTTARPGPSGAKPYLGTPLGLALRLQRSSIIGWTLSMLATGLIMGLYSDSLLASANELPDVFIDLFGSSDAVLKGYFAYMAGFIAYFTSVYAIASVQALRREETTGRAEALLATPLNRRSWLANYLLVSTGGIVVVLLFAGLGTGLAASMVTGEWSFISSVTLAHLNQVIAVLFTLSLATLLFGWAPRAITLTWIVLGISFVIGTFGTILNLPQLVMQASPFTHLSSMPVEPFRINPWLIQGGLTILATAIGLIGLNRRSINIR